MSTVLLAHADRDQRVFLADQLTADGRDVVDAASYDDAIDAAQSHIISLAIVDLELSGRSATRLIREVRAGHHYDLAVDLPILALLPEYWGAIELARAFAAGADDVMYQPVGYVELRCRVEALVRRCGLLPSGARCRRVGDLEIDLVSRTVSVGEHPVMLSKIEFDLLAVLAGEPTRVFTKRELLSEIWGMPEGVVTRTLDSHACRIRQKLAARGGRYVVNRWGVGYALIPPA